MVSVNASPLDKGDLLDSLRVFLSVARCGSMSRAAGELDLDVSIVSRKLGMLERHYGHALFERHSRGVRLTQAGVMAELAFQRMMAEDLSLRTDLDRLRRIEGGMLRISSTGSALAGPLSDVLLRFSERYPAVQVEIKRLRSREVVASVQRGSADIGIGLGLEEDPAVDIVTLFPDTLAAVMRPAHPLAGRAVLSCADLRHHPIATFEFTSRIGGVTRQYLARASGEAPQLLANSLEVLKHFAAGGSGIAIMCRSSVRSELSAGTLAAVPLQDAPVLPQSYCIRRASMDERICRAFLDEFRALVGA